MAAPKSLSSPRRVAALYIRVSTDDQAQNGHSLAGQKDALKDCARQHGFKYHRVYEDAGRSAKDLNRPELQRMLTDIYAGKITDVLVWKVDRLSRNQLDLLELVEFFKAYGVHLTSATEPMFDTSSPTGEFMLSLLGGFAQMERGRLIERIQLGLNKRQEQRKWTGSPPFGYSYSKETETLEINEGEAAVVREAFKTYLKGGTIPAVKAHLTKTGSRPRNSKEWAETTIAKVLRNQIYIGKVKQGKEWKDENLRIITDRQFQDCQTQRAARRHLSPKLREVPKDYADGMFCSNCGRHCLEDMAYCPGCGSQVGVPAG